MKVTITEVRLAKFHEFSHTTSHYGITIKYEVWSEEYATKTFGTIKEAKEYVKYLKEKKNDYKKIIEEIEI